MNIEDINDILWHSFYGDICLNTLDINTQAVLEIDIF